MSTHAISGPAVPAIEADSGTEAVPAIEALGLHKTFKGVRAVAGVDLTVAEGTAVGLLGPNGAGKTTTLMMLLGITEPDAGTVRLLGRRLPEERVAALSRCGFAASYVGLSDRLKVREMLGVFCDLYDAPYRRVSEVAEKFGITELLGRFGSQLSSGQRTLVGLARAMLNRPRLLILDEPTASLDPEVAARIRGILTDARRQDRFTLLITSHNMADIERLCSRVVFIAGGRIVADGHPAALASQLGVGNLEDAFLTIASTTAEVAS